jgi:ATP-dependent helicase/nuclease subunit A
LLIFPVCSKSSVSSAGSGKTYTLTKEYLKLALGDRSETGKSFESHQFKNILAVTFTNAAART